MKISNLLSRKLKKKNWQDKLYLKVTELLRLEYIIFSNIDQF